MKRDEVPGLVSAIIPSWNRKADLMRCIESIHAQDYADVEIIVADDASTDGTPAEIPSRYPEVVVLTDDVRCGPYYRRNEALNVARGEFLLLLDSDTILQDSAIISRMVEQFRSDSRVGVLGGEIPIHAGDDDHAIGLMMTPGGYTRQIRVDRGQAAVECDALASLNFMVRRDDSYAVGGFDPYYIFGLGDVDFCLAVRDRDRRNLVGFGFGVQHDASPAGRRPDVVYRYCVTRIRFLIKCRGIGRTLAHFVWDLAQLAWFCICFPLQRLFGREVSQLKTDGLRYIPRAYLWNLLNVRETIRSRTIDFLCEPEMKRFYALKVSGRL
tara:strand:+ start:735 stop:1712 length:978 start_codon:yes stop_codon:yes gene_type:complete